MISLINRKQITVNDIDKKNNLIKLKARKVIIGKILDKIYSTITYNGETMSYAQIIDLQTKNLVKTLLHDDEFNGFYITW